MQPPILRNSGLNKNNRFAEYLSGRRLLQIRIQSECCFYIFVRRKDFCRWRITIIDALYYNDWVES